MATAFRPDDRRHGERPRRRLADLFWHGLTAIAFAGVVALMFVQPSRAASAGVVGSGRVVPAHVGGLVRDIDTPVQGLTRPPS